MKIINLQLKIALLLLFMCFKLSAEKILDAQTLEQAKAHYLLEIIKHITQKPEKILLLLAYSIKMSYFTMQLNKKYQRLVLEIKR